MLPFVVVGGEFALLATRMTATFWMRQIVAGLLGFALNIVTYLSIKLTSPLTHNLTGIVKGCIQTILAVWIFRKEESMTMLKIIGTIMIFGFTALYGWAKKRESKDTGERTLCTHDRILLIPLYIGIAGAYGTWLFIFQRARNPHEIISSWSHHD
jgi:hypothetical protein